MTSVTDPLGHVTSYQYDQLGRQVSHALPMGQSETWAYNSLGQMTQHIDFNGQKTTYVYDALGRLQTKNLYQTANATSSTSVSSYTYDVYDTNHDGGYADSVTTTTDGTTTSNYDLNGNLVKVTSPQGVIQYGYDALNRKTGLTTSNTHQTYAYDALGRLASTTVDKLNGVSIAAPLVTSYSYDLNSNLTATTQANGVVESRFYDTLNRLVQIKDILGSTTLTSFHYGLDPAGNRLDLFEASGRSETYSYDNLYSTIEWTSYIIAHAGSINRFVIYLPTFPGLPYREIPIASPSNSRYKLVLGFGAGSDTTSKAEGRLTGIGFGLQGEALSMQIWRMDTHTFHGDRGDDIIIKDEPFHYHVRKGPKFDTR